MNPLLVTWSPLEYTDVGKNLDALNNSGFTCLKASPNGKFQKACRLWLENLEMLFMFLF